MTGPGSVEAITGSLLGLAAGDALGLPYEGLSSRRARRLLGEPEPYRLVPGGRGMFSDDTEHAAMTVQALIESGGEPGLFARALARRLRFWLLALPAGVGFATLRSILKLWVGIPPSRSGVFSAGNGPAMRSPILGAAVSDLSRLRVLVRESTRLTHTDPRAEQGAFIVALAARQSALGDPSPEAFLAVLKDQVTTMDPELSHLIASAARSAQKGESTPDFAQSVGLERGVTGFISHTVPVSLHASWSHPGDLPAALCAAVLAGGDADTVAAITGGIVGAGTGPLQLTGRWRAGLAEWPRTLQWLERLGPALVEVLPSGPARRPPGLPVVPLLLRNVVFLVLVLAHGFRRLFPPY
ncbi:MAG: hypothetical protein DIJKHBIC_00470 [Thermoanaerobaculia bacterium]|nr:hypothetical protein [Thermoanaerobaculia bacterium]